MQLRSSAVSDFTKLAVSFEDATSSIDTLPPGGSASQRRGGLITTHDLQPILVVSFYFNHRPRLCIYHHFNGLTVSPDHLYFPQSYAVFLFQFHTYNITANPLAIAKWVADSHDYLLTMENPVVGHGTSVRLQFNQAG